MTFGRALDPSSSLLVTRLAVRADAGEFATAVAGSGGLDSSDAERRTLQADLFGAPDGVYRAAWTSVPASGGVMRRGEFRFAVGVVGSESVVEGQRLEEHDSGERRRRSSLAGGVLLLLLGALSLAANRAVNGGRVSRTSVGD